MIENPFAPIPATQCHDLDAVPQTRDAAAAERKRRLMDDKRQCAGLAAAVTDHRMVREEWHLQRQDDVSHNCDLGTHVHALCAKAKRIAAIENACGGVINSVRAFGTVIQHLVDFFFHLTIRNPRNTRSALRYQP